MKVLLAAAVMSTLGLGYLAIEPDLVADQLSSRTSAHRLLDDGWLEQAEAQVEAGNPYWEVWYSMILLNGSDDVEGLDVDIRADADRAHQLIESAVDKGLTQGLFMAWMFTGRSDDALLTRAADLGDPNAIKMVLGRLLRTAECTPEGRTAFTGAIPSREALSSNYSRAALVYESYSLPEPWRQQGYREMHDRLYAEVSKILDLYETGMECTPDA